MSDAMFSRHAALNAGAIPASAEELSQRYLKLFQQYSRLKAQHAVLKKAVIQEQASNISLQGDVKEKEKELRKLQEQLDLLAFHNERLTKRIQAVQDSEQKGSHFSLLGGSVKKELEKSVQALEEANLDLERKILENEQLHDELKERQFEFTDSINLLLKQIQDLENRVQELSDENASLILGSAAKPVVTDIPATPKDIAISSDEQELKSNAEIENIKQELNAEIHGLKQELNQKTEELNKTTELLKEKEQQIQQNDQNMLSEITSLRSILLAKVGELKQDQALYDVVPEASTALKQLQEQYYQYVQANTIQSGQLPHEIADKLAISHETYQQELSSIVKQLQDTKSELSDILKQNNDSDKIEALEKQYKDKHDALNKQHLDKYQLLVEKLHHLEKEQQEKCEELEKQYSEKHATMEAEHKEKYSESEKRHNDKFDSLEKEHSEKRQLLEKEYQEKLTLQEKLQEENINEKIAEIAALLSTIQTHEKKTIDMELANSKLVQENEQLYLEKQNLEEASKHTSLTQIKEEEEEEEEEAEVFVYPKKENDIPKAVKEDEEEEDEVFIYRGRDAVIAEEKPKEEDKKLKDFYEQQISNLTEKLQLTDSKAVRFASMYKSLKDKLLKEEQDKLFLIQENEKLQKEVKNVQELLSTTESNYQKQVDTMTEFISSQEQQMRQQRARHHNNNNHR